MMKKTLYIIMLIILSVQSGISQNTLTLEECIEMAIENNNTLKERRLEIAMAEQTQKEMFTKYFPDLSASASYFKSSDPILSTDVETTTLPLPDMGLPPVLNIGMMEKGTVAAASATQTLYAGGMVRNANRLTKLGVEVSKLQYTLSNDEVRLKTEEYYLQCVQLESKHKTITSALDQLRELRRQIKDYVDAGAVNNNDLMRVELELSTLESQELTIKNGETLSKLLLAQHIGMASDSFTIADMSDGDIQDPQSLLVDFNTAVDATTEISLLGKQIEASDLELKIAKGERMPKVALGGAYAYNNLLDKNNDFFVGFATVSVPITGWWSGAHKVKKAKLKQQQSELQYSDTAEKLHLHITQLYMALTESYQQVMIAKRRVLQAEENLRLNRDRYDAGVVSLVDLLEAQTLQQQSRDTLTDAYIGYKIALSRYELYIIIKKGAK